MPHRNTRLLARCIAAVTIASVVALAPVVAGAEPGTGPFAPLPRVLSTTASGTSAYDAVACGAPTSCVAVGPGAPLISTLSGAVKGLATAVTETAGTWGQATRLPLPAGALGTSGSVQVLGVACPAATSCIAVGAYKSASQTFPLIETDTSGTWTASSLTSPSGPTANSAIDAIWCAPGGGCEAIGFYEVSATSIVGMAAVETAGTWEAPTSLPAPLGAFAVIPTTISCNAIGTCSAAGVVLTAGGSAVPYAWTEAGGTWSAPTRLVMAGSLTFEPSSITCPASSLCFLVGTAIGQTTAIPAVATDVSGTWTVTTLALPRLWPDPTLGELESVSCDPSVCEAVGLFATSHQKEEVGGAVTWSGSWSAIDLVHGVRVGARAAMSTNLIGVSCSSLSTCTAIGDAYAAGSANNPFAATITMVRTPAMPGPPTDVVTAPTPSGARVAWASPVDDGGGPVTSFTATALGGGSCHSTALGCAIVGLHRGHTYAVTVTATSAAGTSGPSSRVTVVPGVVPTPPAVLHVTVTGNVAAITWHASHAAGERVLHYVVTLTAHGRARVVVTAAPGVRIGGIVAHQPYELRVVAEDATGSSAPASTHFVAP